MKVFDELSTILATLSILRIIGIIIFVQFYINNRSTKYIVLILGWLLLTIGSFWGWYTYSFNGEMENFLFSIIAALGTLLLVCGALLYFNAIRLRSVYIASLIIVIYSLLPLRNIDLGPSPGLIVQFLTTLLLLIMVIFKRKIIIYYASSSYYWLVSLAIISMGMTFLFSFGIIGQDNLAVGFIGTTLINVIVIVFFLHIENSLSMHEICESEKRYRMLFDFAPIGLWEEDLSGIFDTFVKLNDSGVEDISQYIESKPEFVGEMLQKLKVVDVNHAAIDFHKARDKEDLINNLEKTLTPDTVKSFIEIIIAVFQNKTVISKETSLKTLNGDIRHIILHCYISLFETDSPRALISFTDISEKKQAERELIEYQNNLQKLVKQRTSELEEKNSDLQSMNDAMIDREYRIKELRDEIQVLKNKL